MLCCFLVSNSDNHMSREQSVHHHCHHQCHCRCLWCSLHHSCGNHLLPQNPVCFAWQVRPRFWQGNPISVVKTFATKNCSLCAILKQSRSNPQLLVNSNNKICGSCGHRPCFHRCVKKTTPSTDESINDERASPTHKVATDFARCNVCLVDVQLEALWGPTKRNCFLFVSRALASETILTSCHESVTLCCSAWRFEHDTARVLSSDLVKECEPCRVDLEAMPCCLVSPLPQLLQQHAGGKKVCVVWCEVVECTIVLLSWLDSNTLLPKSWMQRQWDQHLPHLRNQLPMHVVHSWIGQCDVHLQHHMLRTLQSALLLPLLPQKHLEHHQPGPSPHLRWHLGMVESKAFSNRCDSLMCLLKNIHLEFEISPGRMLCQRSCPRVCWVECDMQHVHKESGVPQLFSSDAQFIAAAEATMCGNAIVLLILFCLETVCDFQRCINNWQWGCGSRVIIAMMHNMVLSQRDSRLHFSLCMFRMVFHSALSWWIWQDFSQCVCHWSLLATLNSMWSHLTLSLVQFWCCNQTQMLSQVILVNPTLRITVAFAMVQGGDHSVNNNLFLCWNNRHETKGIVASMLFCTTIHQFNRVVPQQELAFLLQVFNQRRHVDVCSPGILSLVVGCAWMAMKFLIHDVTTF